MKIENASTGTSPPGDVLTITPTDIRRTSAQTTPLITAHKRRALRRLGLTLSELDPIGRGYLELFARLSAKLDLADRWFEKHGFIGEGGSMSAIAQHYCTIANSASRTLARLEDRVEIAKESQVEDVYARYRGDA